MGQFDLARAARLAGIGAFGLLLSACSMGNMFAPGKPSETAQLQNTSATPAQISAASTNALPAIATECPEIKVRPGSEALYYYGKGKVGDPRSLNYQAVIEKQSRNCVVSNGLITVKMGVVGRLLLGPAGNQEKVDLPLRFAVERDDVAVFSERYDIPVSITPPNQSEEFVKVVENVGIPYLGGERITIWVGFDTKR
ncbi:MAG: hypothetical protein EOP19_14855 [Hyphomicrobiales bacterium]|nr:MAG: hypothetical protein EOP19_14855 [Hyphomicrobiales bacterium]